MESAKDPFLGRTIDGRFLIQSVLGRGGMGVVYAAHQSSLERSVALKIMTGTGDSRKDAEFQRRFFLEAATAAKLKHPNTITVFDYGSDVVDGSRIFFIAMELLDGVTLSKAMANGPMAPMRCVHLALQMCRSLREAHAAGVVHRDLKPGNVMLVKQDDAEDVDGEFVKVLDFGLAKTLPTGDARPRPEEGLTKAGTFLGSPRYVAPEQIEGRPLDARADIYSFGCVFYRMVAGVVPFDGTQPVEIMMKHLHEPPPPLPEHVHVPIGLEKLLFDCLEKEASKRPPSMDVVLTRLKLLRAELGGHATGIQALSDETRRSLGGVHASASPPPEASDPGDPFLNKTVAGRVDVDALFADDDDEPKRDETRQGRRRARTPARASTPPRAPSPSRPALDHVAHAADEQPPPPAPSPAPDGPASFGSVVLEDSTRPTRVLGKLVQRERRSAVPALMLLLVVAVGAVAAFAWRAGLLERPASPAAAPTSPATDPGQAGRKTTLRVTSSPPGADVTEIVAGLPRFIGTTPLTEPWVVPAGARPRVLLLRLTGHRPMRATVVPPAADKAWVEVDAVLVPE